MRTIACLSLFLLTASFAQTPPDGKLTVSGQVTKLTQAYTYVTKGFFDEKKDDTVVLLTDRAITGAQLRDGFALRRLAEEGRLSFVQETINAFLPDRQLHGWQQGLQDVSPPVAPPSIASKAS